MSSLRLIKETVLVFFLIVLCGVEASQGQLHVVASNSIIKDLVYQVAGNYVDLAVLVASNNDPHSFEPQPQDNVKLAKADVIFENGLFLEPWMDKLYRSSGANARRVILSNGVELIGVSPNHDHHDDHDQEYDPHVWHDVDNVRHMVQMIKNVLMQADPENSQGYQVNAAHFDQELVKLDQWIMKQVEQIPPERRKLITSHDTFGYFARRYGFDVVGTVIDSATTEVSDPSALKLSKLVRKVLSSGVSVIFVENVSNPQLVKTIAKESKITIAPPLYTDALGGKDGPAGTYIQMMRTNVNTIVEALRE